MSITRIYTDNICDYHLGWKHTLDYRITDKVTFADPDKVPNIKEIMVKVFPKILTSRPEFTRFSNDEVSVIIIESDIGNFCRTIDPEGNIVVDEFTGGRFEKEGIKYHLIQDFWNKLTSSTYSLDYTTLPRDCSDCVGLFNSVIPAIFEDCSEVYPNGSVKQREHVFERSNMGSGYNQVLRILYLLNKAKNEEGSLVYLKYWCNHLHINLRKWFWENIFTKLHKYNLKGRIIIDKLDDI